MNSINHRELIVLLTALVLLPVSQGLLAGGDTPHWTYGGAQGPEHWGELADEYHLCSEGVNQSPVDLVADVPAELPELQFEYYSSPLDEINNGHTIQQNVQAGSFLRVPELGLNFELKQFHFHSPSEHTVAGQSYAMEVHFVHADQNGALAVVGVLFNEGDKNPVLDQLWAFMPEEGQSSRQAIGIEQTGLLPPTREYFSYAGSLTTPPCSEGVRWAVLKTPIEASAEQIAVFKKRMGLANNRPVQPHNARLILD